MSLLQRQALQGGSVKLIAALFICVCFHILCLVESHSDNVIRPPVSLWALLMPVIPMCVLY